MDLYLTDHERDALVELLTREIEFTALPVSRRVERLGRIRAKLTREETGAAEARKPHPGH